MPTDLADECVYTIVHVDRLEDAMRAGVPTTFREGRQWVGAAKLWQEARRDGLLLPLLFADAADCSLLLFWGELREVRVDDTGTEYVVANLHRIDGRHAPQDLTLLKSGEKIAPNFIRPYALCRTPAFLTRA